MPWVMDMYSDRANEFVWGGGGFERIIVSDQELLLMPAGLQFFDPDRTGIMALPDEENLTPFLRAEFEKGRCYYRLAKSRKTLPARAQPEWFCDRFKRVLQELEPGKHRFVEIDIRMTDGVTPWPEQYWHWRCENFVDAIVPTIGDDDPDRSGDLWWDSDRHCLVNSRGNAKGSATSPVWRDRPVLSAGAIEGVHAWRENGFQLKFSSRWFFLSDEFVERLSALDAISGLGLGRVDTSSLAATRDL